MRHNLCWHVRQFAIALDQAANALFGGWADETLSARCYRLAGRYWYAAAMRWLLDLVLSPCARNHCEQAYQHELDRTQLPAAYRN